MYCYVVSSLCLPFLVGRYHLKDVIVGKIYFLLVRIKIRHMELQIIKRETTGAGMEAVISCWQYWYIYISTLTRAH